MESRIDFSAQFGGRDAAQEVLPHFKALKHVARNVVLKGFPFPKLAFILRVDGEVNRYGLKGAGNMEFDKSGNYVSIDIGIPRKERCRLSLNLEKNVIVNGLVEAVNLLITCKDKRIMEARIDWASLEKTIETMCENYTLFMSTM